MRDEQTNVPWILGAVFLVLVVLFGLRWSSSILSKGATFDEKYITVPINTLINEGWSVETAIDYQETKGPAMIWTYAFFGKLLGGSLNDLRLVSVWSSIFAMGVLAWIASLCGIRHRGLYLVAIGWLLLPYNLVFSEIVMGELSFQLLELLAIACFIWGVARRTSNLKQYIAPILYCVVVAIALHSRIHVVAIAGAVCVSATLLLGRRSWPWWLASLVAGLLRIPLWIRWDGLVGTDYQALHGLGFRLESLSYLAAAMVPVVGVFAVNAWLRGKSRLVLLITFGIGFGLCMVAMPDLTIPDTIDFEHANDRYQGIVATVATSVSSTAWLQRVVLSLLAGVGLAGLSGLWLSRKPDASVYYNLIHEITCLSLGFGWLLYAFTRGFVFDRFLLVWIILLPIVWIRVLPTWLLALQYIMIGLIAARLVLMWL